MSFDYKKEYKDLYLPKATPTIVNVPKMNYIAVRGKGDPNALDSEYKKSIELLYAIAYTIKMSYKTPHQIKGYFDYVVPPLEGLWWQENNKKGFDYHQKDKMHFISIIRLPDFVTEKDFQWAIKEATTKKEKDFSKVEFLSYDEGLCIECMHIGPYDDEPETLNLINKYLQENNYETNINKEKYHHEIYLSDPRRCQQSKLKTVIRIPIKTKN